MVFGRHGYLFFLINSFYSQQERKKEKKKGKHDLREELAGEGRKYSKNKPVLASRCG